MMAFKGNVSRDLNFKIPFIVSSLRKSRGAYLSTAVDFAANPHPLLQEAS